MTEKILGIDLGTSSVKLLLWHKNGKIEKSKAGYAEKTPSGWLQAIKEAIKELDLSDLSAIGLSSQVGTYLVNNQDVISWDTGIGKEELNLLKSKYPVSTFIKEIAMPHPDIASYPIPRLMYIKNHFDNITSICQPKDLLCKAFTGNYVTDKYSYRGLAHTQSGIYSDFFLSEIGIDQNVLPKIIGHNSIAGITNEKCEKDYGLPAGVPLFTGLNDFFSALLGMGIKKSGDMFDITGTSEHLGLITDVLNENTRMVSGVYFDKFIHYGVTASSGSSLDFAINNFGFDNIDINECLSTKPPIFLPYLNGERAPIFDSNARGTFFGIDSHATKKTMAYSVMEGVVFSLWHIYESMGCPPFESITVSGGAAKGDLLNILKAEMFNTEVKTLSESDTSALGAVITAASGLGISDNDVCFNHIEKIFKPTGSIRDTLLKRYNIYKSLYPALKEQFNNFSII